MGTSSAPASTRNPILWGAYLACSWTWCIGMFLPALLMRDMGWAGFLIFAIPNIIGAAAMGWVFKSKTESVRFVEKHPTAIWWFSAITISFHLFWILWISRFIRLALHIPTNIYTGSLAIALLFALVLNRTVRRERAPQAALVLLLLSLGVLISTFFTPDVKEANVALINATQPSLAPVWMLPVMLFGFLLCPYLDITFHHARQQLDTQKNGRLGFTIGFVGFFTFMILLTTRYAGVIESALSGACTAAITAPWIAAGILTHMLCQWIFTVHVHLDKIRTIPNAQSKQPILWLMALGSGAIGFFAIHYPEYAGITGGEVIYRLFMSAYGLLLPTYVLYRAVMAAKGKAAITLGRMWIAVILATPLFWVGYLERHAIWMIPGVAVLLLGVLTQKKR